MDYFVGVKYEFLPASTEGAAATITDEVSRRMPADSPRVAARAWHVRPTIMFTSRIAPARQTKTVWRLSPSPWRLCVSMIQRACRRLPSKFQSLSYFVCVSVTSGNRPVGCNFLLRLTLLTNRDG